MASARNMGATRRRAEKLRHEVHQAYHNRRPPALASVILADTLVRNHVWLDDHEVSAYVRGWPV